MIKTIYIGYQQVSFRPVGRWVDKRVYHPEFLTRCIKDIKDAIAALLVVTRNDRLSVCDYFANAYIHTDSMNESVTCGQVI